MGRFLFFLFTSMFVYSVSVNAYVPAGFKWQDSNIPVSYYINESYTPFSLGAAAATNVINTAFATWAAVEGSKMDFNFRGGTNIHNIGWDMYNDGYNVVLWDTLEDFGVGVLGITFMWAQGGVLFEADIAFNTYMPWFISGSSSDSYDLQTVALHEIGHFVGLDHVSNPSELMYESLAPGEIKRSLSSDDIRGISALYPGTKASAVPANIEVYKNAPNPFKPVSNADYTLLSFTLNTDAHVRIDIFNMAGELVKTLLDSDLAAGSYLGSNGVKWHGDNGSPDTRGSDCSSGVYIYQVKTSRGDSTIGKIMLIR